MLGSEHLSSVECFDLQSKRWRLKRQMSTPRRGIALAVVEVSGSRCIFAIGGLDDNMCYNNVEKYDPVQVVFKLVRIIFSYEIENKKWRQLNFLFNR